MWLSISVVGGRNPFHLFSQANRLKNIFEDQNISWFLLNLGFVLELSHTVYLLLSFPLKRILEPNCSKYLAFPLETLKKYHNIVLLISIVFNYQNTYTSFYPSFFLDIFFYFFFLILPGISCFHLFLLFHFYSFSSTSASSFLSLSSCPIPMLFLVFLFVLYLFRSFLRRLCTLFSFSQLYLLYMIG